MPENNIAPIDSQAQPDAAPPTPEPATPADPTTDAQPDPTQVPRNITQTLWEQRWAFMETQFHANAVGTHNALLKMRTITDSKEWSRWHFQMVQAYADSMYNLQAIAMGLLDDEVRAHAGGIEVARKPIIIQPG